MKIALKEITVREVTEGYVNRDEEGGVIGYSGNLNIRPKYQREFVYEPKQRNAVIETIRQDFPLNVMYWVVSDDGTYEVLDGQQRTISICDYVKGDFAVIVSGRHKEFHNLTNDEKEQILNYKLMIYFCEGTDSEKLAWFRVINTAGEKLKEQELKNAVYSGPWLSDAKKYFSKTKGPAHDLGIKYMTGSPKHQDYLETVLKWISQDNIEQYMMTHQHEKHATELRVYFEAVIGWVKTLFSTYRDDMKGVPFGLLYNEFRTKNFDPSELEAKVSKLMQDDEIKVRSGIYQYVLSGDEKHLNMRRFTDTQSREAYERQNGDCVICGKHFEKSEMEADHITPWSQGGKTVSENCQMLCKHDNRTKSDK